MLTWWDADNPDNTIDVVTSDTFAEIVDRSGNENHMVQATKANQPDVVIVDSVKFWQTDGVSQNMTAAIGGFMKDTNAYTVFVIVDNTTINNSGITIANKTVNSEYTSIQCFPQLSQYNYSIIIIHYSQSVPTFYNFVYGSTDLRNTKALLRFRCTGSAYDLAVNGVQESLNVAVGANDGKAFDDTGLDHDNASIGLNPRLATAYIPGKIGDHIAYNRALTEKECALVETYLMEKHDIA